MGLLKGITVRLYEKTQTGTDDFNRPVYEETAVDVENVLVAPQTAQGVTDATNLSGKQSVYTLAIPKGDTHTWEDATVEFFDHQWHTTGPCTEGIESMVPLGWHKKVTVERYG